MFVHSQAINAIIRKSVGNKLPYCCYTNYYGQLTPTNGIARFCDTYETKQGKVHRIKYVLDFSRKYSASLYERVISKIQAYCCSYSIVCSVRGNTVIVRFVEGRNE